MASSCCMKLPAMGNPWRIRTSLAVQQMPARLMPAAPFDFAYSTKSSSCEAMASISESVGSCPCTMTLTMSSRSTPRFTLLRTGRGVPNRMSLTVVAMFEPTQPSARLHFRPAIRRCR